MFDVTYRTEVVKCTNKSCKFNIKLSIGKVPGGINDSGGWILECEKCGTRFPYKVKNPGDYSSVISGAKVLDTWDNEVENDKENTLKEWNLQSFPDNFEYENLLLVETGEYERLKFSEIEKNIYFCPSCNTHLEPYAYLLVREKLNAINKSLKAYLNIYVKGGYGNPDSIILLLDYKCKCGWETKFVYYKEFKEKEVPLMEEYELFLIDAIGANLEKDIDGIYTRDDCLAVLTKLLVRWQVYFNRIFIAVPFIGFDYKNAEQKRVDLWNWILKYTIPHKTALLTRKATFNSFLEGAANIGLGVDVLKDYGLLNPTLEQLSGNEPLFKTNFHAKFYAGFNRQKSETLVGSFNVHGGGYFENIHFKSYELGEFFRKYILNMGIIFDPRVIDEQGEILIIREEQDGTFKPEIVSYAESREKAIKENL